eukprot:TRINITY_DN3499_c0_g1_i3.p1 TRINITY_DN3499_c0_g1~~TRINITY_DN3499_c0_g1_i3.p1  ORF type:complete len:519 (-),score=116.19 TRINITY_DN3499_c0_g1_i3:88-1644(-)
MSDFTSASTRALGKAFKKWFRLTATLMYRSFLLFLVFIVYLVLWLITGLLWLVKLVLGDGFTHVQVNGGSPELMEIELPDVLQQLRARQFDSLRDSAFSFLNAKFLLLLSALAYDTQLGDISRRNSIEAVELKQNSLRLGVLFYSKQDKFIVACAKGTDPMNWVEWLTDGAMGFMNGASFFAGQVHSGFFERTFYKDNMHRYSRTWFDLQTFKNQLGFVFKVQEAIDNLNVDLDDSWNIWITGHSLGAAVASMTIAYIASLKAHNLARNQNVNPPKAIQKSVEDQRSFKRFEHAIVHGAEFAKLLDDDIVERVRGAYCFGTPRTGNFEYAQTVQKDLAFREEHEEEEEKREEEEEKKGGICHRVINNNDVVNFIPLGQNLDDDWWSRKLSRSLPGWVEELYRSLRGTRYYHFGNPIFLQANGGQECEMINRSPSTWNIIRQWLDYEWWWVTGFLCCGRGKENAGGEVFDRENCSGWLRRMFVPCFILDHLPSEYYWRLKQAERSQKTKENNIVKSRKQ